jgi:hypothetical protein
MDAYDKFLKALRRRVLYVARECFREGFRFHEMEIYGEKNGSRMVQVFFDGPAVKMVTWFQNIKP